MNYTVNKLAMLSGVSIRTLRFYDKIGLLKPAFVADNGYRYYQEPQLLILEQILFLRELGFELKQIREIMEQNDFDKSESLQEHKKLLHKNIERMKELMNTIDTTINKLREKHTTSEQELPKVNPAKKAQYDDYVIKKYRNRAKDLISKSEKSDNEL